LDAAIRSVLVAADVDLVFLAGYMKKIGGDRVFEAVLEAGETESGVSIHLVDADYDTGAVVRQCRVPVYRGDSLGDLKARVRTREKEFVVETLEKIAKGEVGITARER
jgi:phosphoribosylglycinamide formyltransferase 1